MARGAGVEERRVYETAFKRAVYGDLIAADGLVVVLRGAVAGLSGLERISILLNRKGFPRWRESDSRCWLELEAGMDGQTVLRRPSEADHRGG